MITRLKHIKKIPMTLADGTRVYYYYHRHTGKRIQGEPGTPEFLDSYQKSAKTDQPELEGTLTGLIRDFKRSGEFALLKPVTRRDYDFHLKKIENEYGDMPLSALDDRRIRKDLLKWRDQLAQTSPRQADYTWSVFRRIVQFGMDQGDLVHNHLTRPKQIYRTNRADKIWLPEHVEVFMGCASRPIRTALILALHTGQRQGDLIRLSWTAYDGQSITLRQSKTGRRVYIPVSQSLKSTLDALRCKATTILTNSRSLPWTADAFKSHWRKISKKAGIQDLTFHDLRGTAITLLAEQGCTNPEIASITGHSLKTIDIILDVYASRTKVLAQSAITKLQGSWIQSIKETDREQN